MAIRTISAAGGNWNSTATWVGGVIPTTSDSVLGDATSGPLTVNVGATVQFVDFSAYTQTLTINAGITLGLSLEASTNIFGSGMDFGGTGTLQLNTFNTSWVQNTTNRIPNIRFTGSRTRTLLTDMYVNNFQYSNIPTFNGFKIYVGGDFYTLNTIQSLGLQGTSDFLLDGSGIIGVSISSNIEITGDYNTFGASLTLLDGSYLTYKSGATPTLFNIFLVKSLTANNNITLDVDKQINLFLHNQAVNSGDVDFTINLASSLILKTIGSRNTDRTYTSDNGIPKYIFTGNSVSAITVNMGPTIRTTSSTTNPPPTGSLTYESLSLYFDPNYTHFIDQLQLVGGTTNSEEIGSSQPGVQVPIVLGDKTKTQIINYNFTDVDASGGDQIIAINGILTNTSNITNVYPTGGGGGQTAYTFFS